MSFGCCIILLTDLNSNSELFMKTAITCLQDSLDASIDTRFGRCQNFLVLGDNGNTEKTISNPAGQASRGAGVKAAQTIVDESVNVLITGNIGPNAFNLLKQSGVEINIASAGITAKEAFEQYQKGELQKADQATGPAGKGRGAGSAPGRGRGRGKGRGRNN